jgi:hypothetical protein
MFRYSLSWYIFALTLLESIIKTHLTVHDSSHGFITNNQRYFDSDLSVIHEEITSGLRSGRINDANLKLQVKFEPAFLDFKYRQVFFSSKLLSPILGIVVGPWVYLI